NFNFLSANSNGANPRCPRGEPPAGPFFRSFSPGDAPSPGEAEGPPPATRMRGPFQEYRAPMDASHVRGLGERLAVAPIAGRLQPGPGPHGRVSISRRAPRGYVIVDVAGDVGATSLRHGCRLSRKRDSPAGKPVVGQRCGRARQSFGEQNERQTRRTGSRTSPRRSERISKFHRRNARQK
ncbi:unnamed protein product, partial [Nesidiocoris tenuis]